MNCLILIIFLRAKNFRRLLGTVETEKHAFYTDIGFGGRYK